MKKKFLLSITLSPARDHSPALSVSSSHSLSIPLPLSLLSPALSVSSSYSLCASSPSLFTLSVSSPLLFFTVDPFSNSRLASLDSQPAVRFTLVAFCFSFASLENFLSQSRLRSSALCTLPCDRFMHFHSKALFGGNNNFNIR